MPEETLQWWHRLPREGPIDRIQTLTEAARGRSVIHVGFVHELIAAKQERGAWLHERLATVARSLVGLGLNETEVEAPYVQGNEAHAIDAQSAEVVIAREPIEHLDAPARSFARCTSSRTRSS